MVLANLSNALPSTFVFELNLKLYYFWQAEFVILAYQIVLFSMMCFAFERCYHSLFI